MYTRNIHKQLTRTHAHIKHTTLNTTNKHNYTRNNKQHMVNQDGCVGIFFFKEERTLARTAGFREFILKNWAQALGYFNFRRAF